MAKHNELGLIGEDIAVKYLKNKGFTLIQRNYRKKYGEIDIVCEKDEIIHFVEVKSVSQETNSQNNTHDNYNPEDNMHKNKQIRLKRVISAYISSNHLEKEFSVDLITVKLDKSRKIAKVGFIRNIII